MGDGLVRIIEGGVGAVQVAKIGHIQNKLPSALPIRQFYGGFWGAGGGGFPLMTSWGGRGWQLSSGLCRVDWEGAVHVHNPCGRGRGLSSA